MATIVPQERELAPISRIQRIAGRPDDPYEVIFLNREGWIIAPLTEWYRLRKSQGPLSTRETYLYVTWNGPHLEQEFFPSNL